MKSELPKKIAVLIGGPGSERAVSLATGRGVTKALRSLGNEVVEIDVRDKNFELSPDVDLAFIAIHGTFGEDGQIQKILEDRGVTTPAREWKGAGPRSIKSSRKKNFASTGCHTGMGSDSDQVRDRQLSVPIVVKAPREGSTVGIVIVKTESDLESARVEVTQYDEELLIEKFVPGPGIDDWYPR